ncbi:hypothetical protein P170DRAFT_439033 [Aspergillus steynii IBT 23096]|uniref:Phytanoyl-CoA dioxygenase family protein n=1 Tax=Aspergillus steynii IBT 23096 TaxID=1392250 RepID=A0A2I2G3B4_9EURO|nr:uncharacterized protein P170DRAFT_439033 [Aspergillus steynii IBT 23096]PLB47347.1 hypothetical protein P170DRAFT_439033 [Aspergillus steynii IBT 23096]
MPEPTTPITLIELTPTELESKSINSHNLQHSLEALHRDGVVVLTNAVDPAHLDRLNSRMVPEAKQLYAQASTHRNFGPDTGNIQQEPVCSPEYIFSDVIANPFATAVIESMIGPSPHLRFYSANTAFKATARQPVHIDIDFDMPRMPFAFCVNTNLVDTEPQNGATEIWPGSHIDTDRSVLDRNFSHKQIKQDLLDARRAVAPPVQPALPKGSLIIRDFRLWHAGMPNLTDEPRVMLVTIQFARWYRSEQRFVLPRSLKGKIDFGNVVPCVEWVDEEYDYLQGRHDHDFRLLD